jgi:hypothetical protein
MSRNETSAATRADRAKIELPAPEPPTPSEINRPPTGSVRKGAGVASHPRAFGRPINLERRARFLCFGFGGG